MFRLRTVAVVCLAVAAVVTVAVREAPAGVAPSPSAVLPGALIVALNGNAPAITSRSGAQQSMDDSSHRRPAAPNQSMTGTARAQRALSREVL